MEKLEKRFKAIANQRLLTNAFIIMMVVITIVVFWHSIGQTLAPLGATDLHPYWYHGHYVRLGENPYKAFFEGLIVEGMPEAQPGLANIPANTAPFILLISVLSWLPWPQAKLLWMFLNLLFTLLIPILTIKLLPQQDVLSRFQKIMIFFIFFILQGTRIANWVGQATLFVFCLMLGTLLVRREHKILAGIMLGLALSKYSLAIAVFLFLLLKREYLILALSLFVQIAGIIFVSLLGGHSILLTINYYVRMVTHYSGYPGIHLASLFPANNLVAMLLALFSTLILGIYLWRMRHSVGSTIPGAEITLSFADWHLLSVLLLWTLLVVYHRAYDTLVIIVFVAMLIYGFAQPVSWKISPKARLGLGLFLLFFVGMMSIPSSVMGVVLPASFMPTWYQWVSYAMTLTLAATACIIAWLYARVGSEPLPGTTAVAS